MSPIRRAPPRSRPLLPNKPGSSKISAKSGRQGSGRQDPGRQGGIDPLRARHLSLAMQVLAGSDDCREVLADEAESPLAWLARRKGKDGRALIAPHQFLSGERLRADFTRAQLMPRTTSNWDISASRGARGGGAGAGMMPSDVAIAAQQRLRHALDAAGPEFSGLLLDICCFLKGLEDVERERLWPRASAKVVLQLGLERLARHYGYGAEAIGKAGAAMRGWNAQTDTASP